MSNNLPTENDQKSSETPQTESSLLPLSNTPDLPTSQVVNPLPSLPLKGDTQPIHMSVPTTDLPVRKDGSIVMTLLILFILLISGVGIYLYVAYTNLANQNVPSEINPVSYSQQ